MESVAADPFAPRRPESPPHNLPLELTSFVGRDREVLEVGRLFSERRLLTLCGPGGAGKTRLALAVGQDLVEEFEDGVWWVELARISDPNLVARTVAQVLGVPESPDVSSTGVLVEHLKPRNTLLILDNCEHLEEACADLAAALLRSCPALKILATSREHLRVTGESSWQVPGLSVPDLGRLPVAGELANYEAVHLFVERARAVDAGFGLTEENAPAVTRLCHKLDGIPLAPPTDAQGDPGVGPRAPKWPRAGAVREPVCIRGGADVGGRRGGGSGTRHPRRGGFGSPVVAR